MASSLTCVGVLWACLSFSAALACCAAFYLPFWIQGQLLGRYDAFFGSFRRLNYPRIGASGVVEVVQEYGRYNSFWSIPSPWWQSSTVLVGSGSALLLLVSVVAAAACCLSYVLNEGSARIAGTLQLLACLLICCGVALYPVGWDNAEVREACGPEADVYNPGTCQLSWSAYVMAGGLGVSLLCVALSLKASKIQPGSFRL